jgi:hypothetical protein
MITLPTHVLECMVIDIMNTRINYIINPERGDRYKNMTFLRDFDHNTFSNGPNEARIVAVSMSLIRWYYVRYQVGSSSNYDYPFDRNCHFRYYWSENTCISISMEETLLKMLQNVCVGTVYIWCKSDRGCAKGLRVSAILVITR